MSRGARDFRGSRSDSGAAKLNVATDLDVRLWNDAGSTDPGALVDPELQPATPVQDGVLHIAIGLGSAPFGAFVETLFAAPDVWLELEVSGETLASRQKLQSVAYALQCRNAEIPDGSIGQAKISGAGGSTLSRAYGYANGTGNIASISSPTGGVYPITFTDFSFSIADSVAIATPVVTGVSGKLQVSVRMNGQRDSRLRSLSRSGTRRPQLPPDSQPLPRGSSIVWQAGAHARGRRRWPGDGSAARFCSFPVSALRACSRAA